MIKFNIRGENVEVTDAIRAYVEDKIGKLDKYFNDGHEVTAYVNLKVYSEKRAKVEVTLPAKNVTLRAEDTSQDMYSSIDFVEEKLERQIRKYKTRMNRKPRNAVPTGQAFGDEFAPLEKADEVAEDHVDIVRTKHVALKPLMPKKQCFRWICWDMISTSLQMLIVTEPTSFTVVQMVVMV